jgi:ParB family chromosome partitioning protein
MSASKKLPEPTTIIGLPYYDPKNLTIITDEKHVLYDERIHLPVSKETVENILLHGMIDPVHVRKNTNTGQLEIIAGRQRVRACIEANIIKADKNETPFMVPVIIIDTNDEKKLLGLMISENEIRRSDEAFVRALKAKRCLDRGMSLDEIAVNLGCSIQSVNNYLALLNCDESIIAAVSCDELSADVARKLSVLPKEEQKKQLEIMKAKGATKGRRANKAIERATGRKVSAPIGKRAIKRLLETLDVGLKAGKTNDPNATAYSQTDKDMLAYGCRILKHLLGDPSVVMRQLMYPSMTEPPKEVPSFDDEDDDPLPKKREKEPVLDLDLDDDTEEEEDPESEDLIDDIDSMEEGFDTSELAKSIEEAIVQERPKRGRRF